MPLKMHIGVPAVATVAAVTEAVKAGIHMFSAEGMLISSVVIPSPHPELLDSLM